MNPEDVSSLLGQGQSRFSEADRDYIRRVAGGHPYLLQAAAAAVWDAIGKNLTGKARYQKAGELLYERVGQYFSDLWREWNRDERKAFTIAALTHLPALLPGIKFPSGAFEEDLRCLVPELRCFKATGLVDEIEPGKWRIAQEVMLWWLTDELIAALRYDTSQDDASFQKWLQAQELDGVLTRGQKDQIRQGIYKVIEFVQQNAISLITMFLPK